MNRFWLVVFSCLAIGIFIHSKSLAQENGVYTKLRKAKKDPEKVEVLDLSYNRKVNEFPPEIREFKNLRKLVLTQTFVPEIPGWIAELTKLEHLELRSCMLDSISPELATLSGLRHLDISMNELDTLGFEIGAFVNLEMLDLSLNHLTYVQDLRRLRKLKTLYIDLNAIHRLPDGIEYLSNLYDLRIGANPYEDIDHELERLYGLESLRKLQITRLNYGGVPVGIRGLSQLEFLNLILNQIDTIDATLFEGLVNLQRVWLYDSEPLLKLKDIRKLQKVLPPRCQIKI